MNPFATTFGDRRFLTDRLHRQRNGLGVLFVAWLGDRPAGDVYLWLERAEEEAIRWHLPGVALLTHLEVVGDLRNRGLGSALIHAVERYLVEEGHERVALAVRTDNVGAARLYRRLGYWDWGHGEVICYARTTLPDGRVRSEAEFCHVLVKQLGPVLPVQRGGIRPIEASRSR
ncbi:N-acetyltransferase GCN5 [Amycolatopsis vancoresmycina DSM 44592]|uniref:N-acetyltransferase GCN5 n=1 Tax=Amycolatopsis vancoresmycina DSM 44592 TaxID=1292037 RepID=R1IAZ5_9PSEU|nr:N-acetyltransferase GCN5 [Amycolatopsis vancoresmycina DSM 44592]